MSRIRSDASVEARLGDRLPDLVCHMRYTVDFLISLAKASSSMLAESESIDWRNAGRPIAVFGFSDHAYESKLTQLGCSRVLHP